MPNFGNFQGIIKFLMLFIAFYLSCYAVIGLSSPGNFYLPFVQHHLDFISVLRNFILKGAQLLLFIFHIQSSVGRYTLQVLNGHVVRMVYSCIGYGLLSFWWAFILSISLKIKQKIILIVLGSLFILFCNIIRISLLAYSNCIINLHLNIEQHTAYNLIIYTLLCIMCYAAARYSVKEKDMKNNKLKTK
jgi:exosortase/archaeosortase family protein